MAPKSFPEAGRRAAAVGLLLVLVVGGGAAPARAQPPLPLPLEPLGDSPRTLVLRAYQRGDSHEVIDLCTAYLATATDPGARALYTYYLAAAHHRLSQPARASTLWTRVIEEWPESAFAGKALLGLALVHASVGDWAACRAACDRYLIQAQQGTDVIVAEYWRAEAHLREGDVTAAAAGFRAAIARPGEHELQLDARVGLIQCLALTGALDEAMTQARALEEEGPLHPEYGRSCLRIAQAARNAGDAVRARTAAYAAREADPTLQLEVALILGEAALLEGDGDTARGELRSHLADPGSAAAGARLLADLAWAAFLERDFTRAVALYEQAERTRPGGLRPHDHLRYGLSYLELGDYAEASDILAPLQGEPALADTADALNAVLAEAARRADIPLAAMHLFETGLAEWPDSAYTAWRHERIGRIQMRRGVWRGAAEAYRASRVGVEAPAALRLTWNAAYADARAGRWKDAERQLSAPPDGESPNLRAAWAALRGDAAAVEGHWATASAHYGRAAAVALTPAERDAALVRAARAAAAAGDLERLTALTATATPRSSTAELWELQAALAEAAADHAAARIAWSTIAPLTGDAAARARLYLAWDGLDVGDPERAVAYLTEGTSGAAIAPWVEYGLALAHLTQGSFRIAAAEFFHLAQAYTGQPLAYDAALRAGDALNRAGAWREADTAYLAVRQQVTDRATRQGALLGSGWTLAAHHFDAAAEAAFRTALADGLPVEEAVPVRLWLGREAFTRAEYREAEAQFRTAVERGPVNEPPALVEYWLARSLWEQGQYVAAAATFAGLRGRPAVADYEALVAYWEVRCADALEDDAAVLANAAALRTLFPQTAAWVDVDLAVARAYARSEAWKDALAAYDRVAAADPGAAGARATIAGAACLEALGDRDGAIVRLFRVRPGEHPAATVAEARLALGRTLARAGRTPDARQMLVDVVRNYPETEAAQQAADELRRLAAET